MWFRQQVAIDTDKRILHSIVLRAAFSRSEHPGRFRKPCWLAA